MTEQLPRDQIFISRLTEIIRTNLGNENFGVKELANQYGMSHYSLGQRLNAITHKTARQFIRETRLYRALEMLQNEELTAAEVAYKVGFSSPAYFNTCFHEFFGYPPGAVKKENLINSEKLNPVQVTSKQESKRLTLRILILVSSGFLSLIAIVYLVNKAFSIESPTHLASFAESSGKSVAVLPFKNLSDSTTNQYFIDGLMEEILTMLSKIHDLKVISRTSVEQFRESTKSASEIAKKLHVDYIVEGSGQKYGNSFRLRVQLIEASGDRHIWAESYEQEIRETRDIFGIQSQIAQAIASELKATITPREKKLIEKLPTKSLMAHDLYVRGQQELANKTDKEANKRAACLYHNALKYDSAFAEAYLGLANVYWVRIDQERNYEGNDILERYLDSMLIMTSIAISLDDQMAEAYYARGGCYYNKGNERQALEDWDKAIKYNPDDYSSYWCKGWLYESHDLIKSIDNYQKAALINHDLKLPEIITRIGGDFFIAGFPEKGKEYLTEALKIDGDSVEYLDNYFSYLAENQGEYQKATDHFEMRYLSESTNDLILLRLGFYNSLMGKYKESLKYYKKYIMRAGINQISSSGDERWMEYHIGYINIQNGIREETGNYLDKSIADYTRYFESALEHEKRLYAYRLAALYACRGDKDAAYEKLDILSSEKCFSLRDLILIKNDPLFNNIRNEPGFQKIVKDMESKYQAEHERVRKWLEEQAKVLYYSLKI